MYGRCKLAHSVSTQDEQLDLSEALPKLAAPAAKALPIAAKLVAVAA